MESLKLDQSQLFLEPIETRKFLKNEIPDKRVLSVETCLN